MEWFYSKEPKPKMTTSRIPKDKKFGVSERGKFSKIEPPRTENFENW